ncbi:hypothetical protein cyc_06984 [Cyclospora cayetanensis]|uniref:BolA-like protein n=1 Tax=Cyclospora cayetanensis TaxID=88456 RepID=A0A1D3CYC2_9EIME|nr:hypothetical protein cyc_06984 [Cyclospora cayetanensis]
MVTVTQSEVENMLREALNPVYLQLEDKSCGCGAAYNCLLVSSAFEGLKALERQRLVNKALGKSLEEIHAFSMKCYTPEEWQQIQQSGTD